jgi:hypothetical protein
MKEMKEFNPDKPGFLGYTLLFIIVAAVLVLVVAFFHDLFTGQLNLPSSDPCSQYTSYEAKEFCAGNL